MASIIRGSIIGEPRVVSGVESVNGQSGTVVLDLDDLVDVDTSGVLDGYVLTYSTSASAWVAEAPGGAATVSASSVVVNDSAFSVLTGTNAQTVFDDIDDLLLGSGDVDGPGSSSDEAVARFDGTTGKLLQNSSVFITDAGFVGVGTSAPINPLHIISSASTGQLRVGVSTSGYFNMNVNSTGGVEYNAVGGTGSHRFYANGDLRSVITSTGSIFMYGANAAAYFNGDNGAVYAGVATADPNIIGLLEFGSDNEIAVFDISANAYRYNDGAMIGDGTNIAFLGQVSVSGQLTVTSVRAAGSGGLLIESNSGTNVALFGAGGGSGVTLYGQLNGEAAVFGGAVTVSSSITASNLSGTNTGDQVLNATGFVSAGTGIAITGAGTSASPYVIATSGGGGGASTTQVFAATAFINGTVSAKDYRAGLNLPFGFTINSITTRSVAGTATCTTKINTTAIGATANAISSSEQEQTATSANTFASGDDLVFTITSVSACEDASITVKYTRTLA